MSNKQFTSIYVSISKDDDVWIDNLRILKIKQEKKNYTKNEVVKELINLGMEVVNGNYLRLDPSIDSFVSKLQELTVEMDGEKVVIKKSKQQVYNMIIEKGLQHLND